MACERERYEYALDVWQGHVDDGNFSVPRTMGSVALVLPYIDKSNVERDDSERLDGLTAVVHTLAGRLAQQGRDPVIAIRATPTDIKDVLCDPSISDVLLIGHGCLASVEVDSPADNNRIDWSDVGHMADHLKTGDFVQLTCGTLPRKFNVPLGLMAVSDHRNVRAFIGRRISTDEVANYTGVNPPAVISNPKMLYDDILREFPQRVLSLGAQVHVALGAMKQKAQHRIGMIEP